MTVELIQDEARELTLEEVTERLRYTEANNELLKENMADVVFALDNVGWGLVGEEIDAAEIPLDTIRKKAKITRAMLALNPLTKRGVAVRTAYIWGGGVEFTGLDENSPFAKNASNQKYLLSDQAHGEMESCLATDGNFFLLLTKAKGRGASTVKRIPLGQITGTVSDPENAEDVWFYRREWKITESLETSAGEKVTDKIEYFPAFDYDKRNGSPRQIQGKRVNWDSAVAHHAVNKQTGWRWGLADLTAVIFWTGAHKEFLENSSKLVKAYSRWAFKVVAPSARGVQAASTKVGQKPTRDPRTGEPNDVGSTAVMSEGTNITAMRAGGSVDFKAGTPLAGYIAAGLEIPLTELLADAGDANRSSAETLNTSTDKAMTARQRANKRFLDGVFAYFGMDVKTKFPLIQQDLVYRQIQSIVQALPLNLLSAKEVRKMLEDAFGLDPADKLPTEEELGLMLAANTTAGKEQAALAKEGALNQNPRQNPGVKQPATSNPSNGDNSYRKDEEQQSKKSGK